MLKNYVQTGTVTKGEKVPFQHRRCASYGAGVLHILRHCRKMLHKSISKLCRKVHKPLRTFTDWRIIKICPYLSVCQTQWLFFSAYFIKIRSRFSAQKNPMTLFVRGGLLYYVAVNYQYTICKI